MNHNGIKIIDLATDLFLLEANAKLNLSLCYSEKLADGYFAVNSVMAFCKLANTLEIIPNDILEVTFIDEISNVYIAPKENTITKLAVLVKKYLSVQCAFSVVVHKAIPTAAGLGSGSADAAAFARFLCGRFNIDVHSMARLVAMVGADVTPCFVNRLCFVSGRGEIVEELAVPVSQVSVLLVKPRKSIFSKDSYRVYAESNPKFSKATSVAELEKLSFEEILLSSQNQLTEGSVSLVSEVGSLLLMLQEQKGCLVARMAGSGPTCYAIFKLEADAQAALRFIEARSPDYWMTLTELI